MSNAAAADAAPPAGGGGKKKLIMLIVVALLVLGGGGAAAMLLLKKKPVDEEGAEAEQPAATAKHDPKAVPTFVPLEPFTVNLADREAERYAQVGITLEVSDAKLGDQIKLYMPAIRNNILMAIADQKATELLDREGKNRLAERVRVETSRALGYEVAPPAEAAEAEDDAKAAKGKKKKKAEVVLPIKAVHFSNFIVQ